MPIEFPALCSIETVRFPELLRRFLDDNPLTLALEDFGVQLQEHNFPLDACHDFVWHVCEWGGGRGYRIRRNVLVFNTLEEIATASRKASDALANEPRNIGNALEIIDGLYGFDVSFASKYLRFLCPEFCPVLDSIISERLFFRRSTIGYRMFSEFCGVVANELNNANTEHPVASREGQWFRADVEASIFTYFRRLRCAWL
jgi:hypothetical protein